MYRNRTSTLVHDLRELEITGPEIITTRQKEETTNTEESKTGFNPPPEISPS